MLRLIIKKPERVTLHLRKGEYPSEKKLELSISYKEALLEKDSESEEYNYGFYVLNSFGHFELRNPTRNVSVNIAAEVAEFRISGRVHRILRIASKPLSGAEICQIDEKLRPDDLEIYWSIDAYGFLEEDYAKRYNVGLIPIFIGTERTHKVSRREFIENVLQTADMLRREFIEVVVEPIDLSYVKDSEVRSVLQLLLEKQKLLLGAMNKLNEAKTATDFRGIIDEVRRVVEGLYKLRSSLEKIYKKLGYIESEDLEAVNEASMEMASAVVGRDAFKKLLGLTEGTFNYASRFGIHTETLSKKSYTPIPTRIEAEFAVQQALIELNYLIRLVNVYAMRT